MTGELQTLIPQIDQIFAPWDTTRSPGMALALVKDSEVIYQRGYGMASLEYGVPIAPRTIFQIGSVSKQFTAMAIALLAKDGKLHLDDDVHKYIPEMPDFGATITVRHLVHHTSGLRDLVEVMLMAGGRMDDPILPSDYLDYLPRQRELNFTPGEKHLYCNTGYTLMAFIVERVSGMPLAKFCEERLFKPLGMTSTLFHDDYKLVVPNFASAYSPTKPGVFLRDELHHGLPGSTSLLTHVQDLAKWDQEFYDGKVVGKDIIDLMHQQGVLNSGEKISYAFGIVVDAYRCLKTVAHSGSDAGYRSVLLRFPDQHFTVIILSNLASASPEMLARKVTDLVLQDVFPEAQKTVEQKDKPLESVTPTAEELLAKAGLYHCPGAQLSEYFKLEVRQGKLILALGPGFDLEPLGHDTFRLTALPIVSMRFQAAADGSLTMVLNIEEESTVYQRVEQWMPGAEALQVFAGNYYSQEMDSTYRITLREGQLWLKLKRQGEFPLFPALPDQFTLDLSALVKMPYSLVFRFERRDGQLAGLRFSSGRAKNLHFSRID